MLVAGDGGHNLLLSTRYSLYKLIDTLLEPVWIYTIENSKLDPKPFWIHSSFMYMYGLYMLCSEKRGNLHHREARRRVKHRKVRYAGEMAPPSPMTL